MRAAKTIRVLIVDDQSQVRDVLRRTLERSGRYAIAEASSQREAVDLIHQDPPDVIILDISMPGGPGFAVIPVVRRSFPATKIVVLSSHHEMGAEMIAMGADAFLPKTAPPKQVLATIAELVAPPPLHA